MSRTGAVAGATGHPPPGRCRPPAPPAGALSRYVLATTPWAVLLTGCASGTAALWLLRHAGHASAASVDQDTVRTTALPAVAALAFVPRTAFRPLVDATPVPAWLVTAGQIALTAPVLALTWWLQLLTIRPPATGGPVARPAAVYPLLAQLTGWCALALAAAAGTDRSRYADLGGALAAPVSLALIALAAYAPGAGHLLVSPPASPLTAAVAWYVVAAVGLAFTGAAARDRWPRYTRHRAGAAPRR